MKHLSKIVFVVLAFFSFTCSAEQVKYLMTGQGLSQHVVIDYKDGGSYEVRMNGGSGSMSFDKSGSVTMTTIGNLIIKMFVEGPYFHNRLGQWRSVPVITSYGGTGFANMLFVGITPMGRMYREEFWLNGDLFDQSETIIDSNDRIIWSTSNGPGGILTLIRE